MNMNERLRRKIEKRDSEEAKEFASQYRENTCKFNAAEYEKAKKRIQEFRENESKMKRQAKV